MLKMLQVCHCVSNSFFTTIFFLFLGMYTLPPFFITESLPSFLRIRMNSIKVWTAIEMVAVAVVVYIVTILNYLTPTEWPAVRYK